MCVLMLGEGLLVKIQRRRELRDAESKWRGEMQRAAADFVFRNATLGLGLKNILFIHVFFLSVGLVEPVRFDSIQLVLDFGNRNRTETFL